LFLDRQLRVGFRAHVFHHAPLSAEVPEEHNGDRDRDDHRGPDRQQHYTGCAGFRVDHHGQDSNQAQQEHQGDQR